MNLATTLLVTTIAGTARSRRFPVAGPFPALFGPTLQMAIFRPRPGFALGWPRRGWGKSPEVAAPAEGAFWEFLQRFFGYV
jgi:hypothetical protein